MILNTTLVSIKGVQESISTLKWAPGTQLNYKVQIFKIKNSLIAYRIIALPWVLALLCIKKTPYLPSGQLMASWLASTQLRGQIWQCFLMVDFELPHYTAA